MPERVRAWTAAEPLGELTLFSDWDSVAAMITSLRVHAFEYGTIPVWNFSFCGGRPELAIPFSWAYTWPSLFAYALAPNVAIVTLWILLTGLGVASTAALLRGWTGSRLGAAVGALVYALSGYFVMTFVAGHVTFAFFHLVPVAMLLFERSLAASARGRASPMHAALGTLVAFALWSGGLPHAIFHFLPAFAGLVLLRGVGPGRAPPAAVALPLAAHGLGLWLAAYKLWPVARWQLGLPRGGIFSEARTPYEIVDAMAGLTPGFLGEELLRSRDAFALGGSAYLGPVPWLLAALPLLALARRAWRSLRRSPAAGGEPARGPAPHPDAGLAVFALGLVVAGVLLALGNEHPLSPARVFRHLPLLAGIRGFSRFEVLSIFGVAVLVAQALAGIPRGRALLAALVLAPLGLQAALLVWRIPATPKAAIAARYGASERPALPAFVGVRHGLSGHREALLERGWWIANCYENVTIPGPPLSAPVRARIPLATPAPVALESVGRDRLTLRFDPDYRGPIRLNLPASELLEYEPEPSGLRDGRAHFRAAALPGHRLQVRARPPGPGEGAWASASGLAATLLFYAAWLQRRRRAG
jgi:hypothetical protein